MEFVINGSKIWVVNRRRAGVRVGAGLCKGGAKLAARSSQLSSRGGTLLGSSSGRSGSIVGDRLGVAKAVRLAVTATTVAAAAIVASGSGAATAAAGSRRTVTDEIGFLQAQLRGHLLAYLRRANSGKQKLESVK